MIPKPREVGSRTIKLGVNVHGSVHGQSRTLVPTKKNIANVRKGKQATLPVEPVKAERREPRIISSAEIKHYYNNLCGAVDESKADKDTDDRGIPLDVIRRALRKVHENLGHPNKQRLLRASAALLQLQGWLRVRAAPVTARFCGAAATASPAAEGAGQS